METRTNVNYAPAVKLNTSRGLLKFILLTFITFGIYALVAMSSISSDINLIASRYDGRKTMHFCLLAFIICPITLGIGGLVWFHSISDRIGNELRRRSIPLDFNASSFWLWGILGAIIVVGPFVYYYKLFQAMNMLSADFNIKG